jgi:transposase-like protein
MVCYLVAKIIMRWRIKTGHFLKSVIGFHFLGVKIFFRRNNLMTSVPVTCPNCGSEKVVRRGKSEDGKQRYLCRNENCKTKSFMTDYSYNGRKSEVRKKIVEMSLSGNGIRKISRALGVSANTVMSELKKKKS